MSFIKVNYQRTLSPSLLLGKSRKGQDKGEEILLERHFESIWPTLLCLEERFISSFPIGAVLKPMYPERRRTVEPLTVRASIPNGYTTCHMG